MPSGCLSPAVSVAGRSCILATKPGVLSHGRIDPAAVLLAERVPVAPDEVVVQMKETRLARDAPHGGLEIPGDDLEDRCLASAVAPDDPPTFTFGDGEGDVLERFSGAERDADVRDGEKGHAEMEEDMRMRRRKLSACLILTVRE